MDMNYKFSHIVFSIILLVVTAGVNISSHYCAGELYSFRLFDDAPGCCSDTDCNNCHDNLLVVNLADKYVVSDYHLKDNDNNFVKIHSNDPSCRSYFSHTVSKRQLLFNYKTSHPGIQHSIPMIQSFLL